MEFKKIVDIGHPIMGMAMSPDGQFLAFDKRESSDGSAAAVLFHLQKKSSIPLEKAQPKVIAPISFSADGHQLLIGVRTNSRTGDGVLQVWNIEKPESPQLLKNIDVKGRVAFSLNAESILVESKGKDERETNYLLIGENAKYQFNTPTMNYAIAISKGGKYLALQKYHDQNVELWRMKANPKLLKVLNPPPGPISTGVFNPDGTLLALGQSDYDCLVELWDLKDPANPRLMDKLQGHTAHISAIAFSHDMRLLASGSYDKNILVWDISNPSKGNLIEILDGHEHTITGLAFRPGKNNLISSSIDGTIREWTINIPA